MRSAIVVAALLAAPVMAEDNPVVKEIPTKELKLTFPENGKPTEPTELKSAEELTKSPVLAGAADAIKKQVDFTTEKLVLFAWGGSGGDKLAASLKGKGKDTVAQFVLTRGLTRDFRQHFHLYVVPKDAKVTVRDK